MELASSSSCFFPPGKLGIFLSLFPGHLPGMMTTEPSSNCDITKPAPGPTGRSWSRGPDCALSLCTLPSTRMLQAWEGSPVPWLGIQERTHGHGPSSNHLQEAEAGQARRVQARVWHRWRWICQAKP